MATCEYFADVVLEEEQNDKGTFIVVVILCVATLWSVAVQVYLVLRVMSPTYGAMANSFVSMLDVKVNIRRTAPPEGHPLHHKPQARGGVATCLVVVLVVLSTTYQLVPLVAGSWTNCSSQLRPSVQSVCGDIATGGGRESLDVCNQQPDAVLNHTYVRMVMGVFDVEGRCRARCGTEFLIKHVEQGYNLASRMMQTEAVTDAELKPECLDALRCYVQCLSEPGAPVPPAEVRAKPELAPMVVCSPRLLWFNDTGSSASSSTSGRTATLVTVPLSPNLAFFATQSILTLYTTTVDRSTFDHLVDLLTAYSEQFIATSVPQPCPVIIKNADSASRAVWHTQLSALAAVSPLPHTRGVTHTLNMHPVAVEQGVKLQSFGVAVACPKQRLRRGGASVGGHPIIAHNATGGPIVAPNLDNITLLLDLDSSQFTFDATCVSTSRTLLTTVASFGGLVSMQPIIRSVLSLLTSVMVAVAGTSRRMRCISSTVLFGAVLITDVLAVVLEIKLVDIVLDIATAPRMVLFTVLGLANGFGVLALIGRLVYLACTKNRNPDEELEGMLLDFAERQANDPLIQAQAERLHKHMAALGSPLLGSPPAAGVGARGDDGSGSPTGAGAGRSGRTGRPQRKRFSLRRRAGCCSRVGAFCRLSLGLAPDACPCDCCNAGGGGRQARAAGNLWRARTKSVAFKVPPEVALAQQLQSSPSAGPGDSDSDDGEGGGRRRSETLDVRRRYQHVGEL